MIQFFVLEQFNANRSSRHVWKNTAWVISGQLTSLIVNITDKVVPSCIQPIVPHLTELSDLFNTFRKEITYFYITYYMI